MRFKYSRALAIACALVPMASHADLLVRFDATKGVCQMLDIAGVQALRCDAVSGPVIALGAEPFVREVVGPFVDFRFPGARQIAVTLEGEGVRLRFSTEQNTQPTLAKEEANEATPKNPVAKEPIAHPVDSSGAPVDAAGVLVTSDSAVPDPKSQDADGPARQTSDAQATSPQFLSQLPATLAVALSQNQKIVQDTYDFSIPESPGFTIIGMTPEDVNHPRTLRDFAFALKDGVDESGKFKTGIALDFTPLQWFVRKQTLEEYLNANTGDLNLDALRRDIQSGKQAKRKYFNSHMLTNTSVSIGTAKGASSNDSSVNLGIGLHIPIIDRSDGRELANDCFTRNLFNKVVVTDGGRVPNVANAKEVNDATSKCFMPRWNDTIWTTSLGYALYSDDGDLGAAKSGAKGIWTSFAYGFDKSIPTLRDNAQLIIHAKVIKDQTVKDPNDESTTIAQDSRTMAAALKFGSAKLNAAFQASFSELEDRTHDKKDSVRKLSVAIEYNLAKDLWFVATIGGEGGRDNGKNNGFVIGSLKYGTAAAPQMARK